MCLLLNLASVQHKEHIEGDVHVDLEHTNEHEHTHSHGAGAELHTLIGVSLVLGFIFMLLVDQLSGGGHSHAGQCHL